DLVRRDADRPAAPDAALASRWEVPLVSVPSAAGEGEVTLRLAGADFVQVESVGLRETTPGRRADTPAPWRALPYGPPPFGLPLTGWTARADRPADAGAERVHLASWLMPGGRLVHHLQLEIRNWRQRTLPLRLPGGARVEGVWADGRWTAPPVPSADAP